MLIILFCFFGSTTAVGWETFTPLDEYVNRPDPNYSWKQIASYEEETCSIYILNMTSQKWLTEAESSQPIWWHYLAISIPRTIRYNDAGFIYISGGSQDNDPPTPGTSLVNLTCQYATQVGVVAAGLGQIPNQPIVFKDDPTQMERSEDAIIAYTWKKFVDNATIPEVALRFPMTKATVRAMDTVRDFARQKVPATNVSRFMLAGESKRGWTTWTTGAVDKRVVAMAPTVLTCLNFVKNVHHFYRALGGWSFALQDYYNENVTAFLDHPGIARLMSYVDPYSYKERLTMPKVIIHAANDEFFHLDDPHYFFDALPNPKYLQLVQDTNHGLFEAKDRVFRNLVSFYKTFLAGAAWPQLSWVRNETQTGGSIMLTSNLAPSSIKAWQADTDGKVRRDFRWYQADGTPNLIQWYQKDVEDLGSGTYRVEYDKTDTAWRAFLLNIKFPAPDGTELDFTTEANVIPDTFPFPDCSGESCRGTIV